MRKLALHRVYFDDDSAFLLGKVFLFKSVSLMAIINKNYLGNAKSGACLIGLSLYPTIVSQAASF